MSPPQRFPGIVKPGETFDPITGTKFEDWNGGAE